MARLRETDEPVWLRVHDVARLLGVSANTVRRWTDAGRIPSFRSPGGHRRYRAEDVLQVAPLPTENGEAAAAAIAAGTHLAATLELAHALASQPEEVPQRAAELLCRLADVDRCELYAIVGSACRVVGSYERGGGEARRDEELSLDALLPGDRRARQRTLVLRDGDAGHAHETLQRLGCRSLLWVPAVRSGELVGGLALGAVDDRDLSAMTATAEGFTAVAAHAADVAGLRHRLERHERAMTELVALSQEVARTHDMERFVTRLAERLMTAVNADCVDVWRVRDGQVRGVLSMTRDAVASDFRDRPLDLEKYPLMRALVQDPAPLLLDSLDDPRLTEHEVADYREWGYASSLSLPLVAGGGLVGIIEIYDDAERDWSRELEFVASVGQLVAGLFDNAVLIGEVEQREQLQKELVELARDLTRTADATELALAAAARLRRVSRSVDCDIWLIEGGSLRCLVSVDQNGRDTSVEGKLLQEALYPTTVACIESRDLLFVPSLDDPRITDFERQDWLEWDFHSNAVVPLLSGDEVVGLIDLFDTVERDFEPYRDFLASAGRMVADALVNTQLVQGLRHSNAALRELVELGDLVADSDDIHELVRVIATRLRDVLAAEDCDVWRIDDDRMVCLASIDSHGWDENEVGSERPLDRYRTTQEALTSGEALVVGDLEAAGLDPSELEVYHRWAYRSMVSVPLVAEGRPVGLIDVFDTRTRDFSHHLDFIRNVGRLLAGALEKALFVERLERGNEDLGTLVQSGLDFAASLDHDAVLRTVAERIREASGADMCDVYDLVDEQVQIILSLGGEFDEDPVGLRYALSDYTLFVEAAESRRPVYVPDTLADPSLSAEEREEAERWGYRATMDIPLVGRGEVIGFISLYNREARPFENEDVIVGLAQIAGQAISNARLYRRLDVTAQRSHLMVETSLQLASSLDLRDTLLAFAHRLCAAVDVPNCDVSVLEGDQVQVVMSLVDGEVDEAWIGHRWPLDELYIAREAIETRLPVEVTDAASDPRITEVVRAANRAYGERSWLALPLVAKDAVVGIVDLVETRRERSFTDDEMESAMSVCHVAAIAIENARLYDEIKQMHLGNLKALSSALNAKDYYTLGHAARVAAYTVMLGRELGWSAEHLEEVEEAAYLHDIGKISISDRVLLKPSRLNQQEWQQMRQHPVFSADIIRPLFDEELVLGVRHHHERYEGGGYPDGIAGEDIPLLARAMAVVDAYDAMSCRRPYKAALTYDECVEELRRCRGTQFDPSMVDSFLSVLQSVRERRRQAERIAAAAAARIPGEAHLSLRGPGDEGREEYAQIAAVLREVRDENPPTRFLTTHMKLDDKFVIGVDPEEEEAERSHFGDEIFADDELPVVLDGGQPSATTVYADEFGVWVTGLAPVRTGDGQIVAAAAADLPAIDGAEGESLRSQTRQTFATMLQSAAVRLSRAEIDAITDALTGLYNHRYLHERLSEELVRAADQQQPLSVLFCDLDHFKAFNDHHGHSAGDRVLREVAHLLEQSVRNIDVAARYGGEEFVVVLVETPRESALTVGERIRARLEAAGFSAAGEPLTVSIGVATFPEDAQRREELLDKADWAMYVAKRRGRNRVVSFTDG